MTKSKVKRFFKMIKDVLAVIYEETQGAKRHFGALVVILPLVAELLGIAPVELQPIMRKIELVGIILFGTGWVDVGVRKVRGK